MQTVTTPGARPGLAALAPWIFVLLWSTGFIGARFGLPYIEPFTFLLIRFVIAAGLLGLIGLALRGPLPSRADIGRSAVVGLLLHGGYLGGVFLAIDRGMPAGVSALIVSLQPILTAVIAQAALGERVSARQWGGLALGLCGVVLVVGERLKETGLPDSSSALTIVAAVAALICTTLGTLYQKRHGAGIPLIGGTLAQYLAAAALMLPLSLTLETRRIEWTAELAFAMSWLVLVLSLGAILLLMLIIRRSSAARTASLFYLVPPATALEAYLIFGERFGPLALAGLALASIGVALVVTAPPEGPRPQAAQGVKDTMGGTS
jgi:drug/metabolite transporter (DMT)-like permease